MPDDPKAGGVGEAVVAEPAKPSAEPDKGAPAGETPEQELVRVRAENEAFRKTQPEWQRKVEDANRILEEQKARGTQPPPTTPHADPLDAEMERSATEIREIDTALAQYPANSDAAIMLRTSRRVALSDYNTARGQKLVKEVTPFFQKIEDAGVRTRASEIWRRGNGMMDPAVALAAARGEKAPDDTKVTALQKELDETKRDLEARKAGVFTSGGVPAGGVAPIGGIKPARTVQQGSKTVRVYSKDEWKKLDNLPRNERKALLQAYRDGEILTE